MAGVSHRTNERTNQEDEEEEGGGGKGVLALTLQPGDKIHTALRQGKYFKKPGVTGLINSYSKDDRSLDFSVNLSFDWEFLPRGEEKKENSRNIIRSSRRWGDLQCRGK